MAQAWLALGANIGDPRRQLADAVAQLSACPELKVVAQSKVVVTKPWGKTDQPDFLNAVVSVETLLLPEALLDLCLTIETTLGRVRRERWGPRLIDIDIIAYERLELRTARLEIPHPFAHERDFVLVPLQEIAPDVADWIRTRRQR